MKNVIVSIILFASTMGSAQVFDVEAIKISGNENKRINLVILSEGYQASELSDFITDATNFTNEMFNTSPFSEYTDYFNVYAVKVPSNESGADDPSEGIYVDTFFNATYDAFGNSRLLYYEIDGNNANNTEAKILSVLADNFPNYDQALILVNSSEYGGSGGDFPMAYNGFWGTEVIMHELGHSLFDLKDEYYPGDLLAGEAINMTQETDPTLVRWKNWLNINDVGIYRYTCSTGNCADWYKPHENSIMEFIDKPFNSVCKEGMILKIYDLVSPIDAYEPVSNTVNNPSFPLDFELTLIKPIPNTLNSTWTLNTANIANDVDDVSLSETDLSEGENTLSVSILDNTNMLKVDNHTTINARTVTWTINYSALGVEVIENEENKFKISLFPNPTSDYLYFKIESNLDSKLRADVISLDGKKVKSVKLNLRNQINLKRLNSGVYFINIYSDNALIASNKVIKN